jgi:hypothetical protein
MTRSAEDSPAIKAAKKLADPEEIDRILEIIDNSPPSIQMVSFAETFDEYTVRVLRTHGWTEEQIENRLKVCEP